MNGWEFGDETCTPGKLSSRSVLGASQIHISLRPSRTPYIFRKGPGCPRKVHPLEGERGGRPPWTASGQRRSRADVNKSVREHDLALEKRDSHARPLHAVPDTRARVGSAKAVEGWCNNMKKGRHSSPRDLGWVLGMGQLAWLAYPRSAHAGRSFRAQSLARSRTARHYPHASPSAETFAAAIDCILARPPQYTFDRGWS